MNMLINGTMCSTHGNLHNMILAWVNRRYRVFDAKLVRSGTGGRGGEGGAGVVHTLIDDRTEGHGNGGGGQDSKSG